MRARTILTAASLSLAALAAALVAYSYAVSQPAVDTRWDANAPLTIAAEDQALTFARSGSRLIRVTGHHGDYIEGMDLSAALEEQHDLLAAYRRLGYEELAAVKGPAISLPLSELGTVIDYRHPHIAAGTNYSEHAEEVYLDDPPFMFPKLAQASGWQAEVALYPRLDFEAELALVPLADIRTADEEVPFGLVLCNDFTDRWTLIREINLGAPMGTTGFAAAKGFSSFLPTGYLFVIPRTSAFYRNIELELALNGTARQRFRSEDMILKPDDIVREAFRQNEQQYWRGEEKIALLARRHIPAGTLILTGTAAGVLFKPVNLWNPGFYLQQGDRVVTRATYLGHLDNRITGE